MSAKQRTSFGLAGALAFALGSPFAAAVPLGDVTYEVAPYIVTQGGPGLEPVDHLTPANEYTGVGDLIINNASRCTASRIASNVILTAAHCVTDGAGNVNVNLATTNVTFETGAGNEVHGVSTVNVHGGWNGDLLNGNDVAVLELASTPTANVATYGLYNGADVGQEFEKVGYGRSGVGATGATIPSGDKRDGRNRYDSDGNVLSAFGLPGDLDSILLFDFDNGLAANDAFDVFFGIADTGFFDEVNTAPGDSGGPGFINGLIAGVTSFGLRLAFGNGASSDIDGALNSSFGEFAGDARVSDDGIFNFISRFLDPAQPAPEPASTALVLGGGLALIAVRRRRRR